MMLHDGKSRHIKAVIDSPHIYTQGERNFLGDASVIMVSYTYKCGMTKSEVLFPARCQLLYMQRARENVRHFRCMRPQFGSMVWARLETTTA